MCVAEKFVDQRFIKLEVKWPNRQSCDEKSIKRDPREEERVFFRVFSLHTDKPAIINDSGFCMTSIFCYVRPHDVSCTTEA